MTIAALVLHTCGHAYEYKIEGRPSINFYNALRHEPCPHCAIAKEEKDVSDRIQGPTK